jgi:Domain of unknown function (DUF2017)
VSGPDPDSTGEAGDLMGGFRARRRGGVTARFAASQANIIWALVSQVEELIAGPAGEDGAVPGAAGRGGAVPGPLEDLEALLGNTGETAALPDDPVLARLLPDAYRDDSEAAGEFRRFTEQELRSGKLAAAQTVLDTLPEDGGRVELTEEDAQVWLRALNDVRLALGVRLEITEDTAQRTQDLDPADPRSAYLWVYDWLTYLQETLVRALW